MIRTFTYPLRPTRDQIAKLEGYLNVCRNLYNAALQERREAWRIAHKGISYNEQSRQLTELRHMDADLAAVPIEIERSPIRRVDRAFSAFFRRCKLGQIPGYPRFRSQRNYKSFSFSFVSLNGNQLRIPNLGLVRFHKYRPIEGTPKEVNIRLNSDGKWRASISCDIGAAPEKVTVRHTIGIDLGISNFATLSDGTQVQNQKFFQRSEKLIARRQRILGRRIRGSKSFERQRVLVAKVHQHVKDQRKDFARKLACTLFERYDLIAHEDLNIRGMARGWLRKPIRDVAWRLFLQSLANKAERAGKHDIAVDPRGSSLECNVCGTEVKKPLGERTHKCACGSTLDRDLNAAININNRALGKSVAETKLFLVAETKGSI